MARYHFNLYDGKFVADRDGIEFPDWEAATAFAVVRAGEAVAASGAKFWKGEHLRIVVTDPVGTALFELRLSGHLPLETNLLSPEDFGSVN